jgi:hypothetical protein
MSKAQFKKGPILIHLILFTVGIVCLTVSLTFFLRRIDYLTTTFDFYDSYFNSREIAVDLPGVSFSLNVAKNDRMAAWRIYSQINTRVAAVDFNEDYDSALYVHQSLYKVFDFIRDEIGNIPVEKIQRDKTDDTVKFYMSILNDGLRPHLSKWHIPLQKWVDNEQKKHPDLSVIEIEKTFPQRKELLESLRSMNARMKAYADKLLLIAKSR